MHALGAAEATHWLIALAVLTEDCMQFSSSTHIVAYRPMGFDTLFWSLCAHAASPAPYTHMPAIHIHINTKNKFFKIMNAFGSVVSDEIISHVYKTS